VRDDQVLVVDDDHDILEILKLVLSDYGYSVRSASNGREALELLRGGPLPSLIILDLMMPEMNGWAFREQQLRESKEIARIPVVVLSADFRSLQKALPPGVKEALRKPVDLDTLLNVVARFCSPPADGPGVASLSPPGGERE
jgi:CheY-like chemotaxis protein